MKTKRFEDISKEDLEVLKEALKRIYKKRSRFHTTNIYEIQKEIDGIKTI